MSCEICGRNSCTRSFHSLREQEMFDARKEMSDDIDTLRVELQDSIEEVTQLRADLAAAQSENARLQEKAKYDFEIFHAIRTKLSEACGDPYKLHQEALNDIIARMQKPLEFEVAANKRLERDLAAARNTIDMRDSEIERWREATRRLREEMEHQASRANYAEIDLAAARLERDEAFVARDFANLAAERADKPNNALERKVAQLRSDLAAARAAHQLDSDMLHYLQWMEEKRTAELDGADYLCMASDGTTCWGKTYLEAVRVAMEYDKGLFDQARAALVGKETT